MMMHECQGRSSARKSVAFAVFFLHLTLIYQFHAANAITLAVGDSYGWSFNIGNWSTDMAHFRAGDILVFNYDPSVHNVVAVDLDGYNRCTPSVNSRTYSSGKDRIKLSMGNSYFICSFPGHCDAGLKIAVSAH